jgi:putative transposase
VQPTRRLGVDRGIYNLASLSIIEEDGGVSHNENIDGMTLRHVQRHHERQQKKTQSRGKRYRSTSRRAMADEAVHTTANQIVEIARQHDAQVVLENLRNLTNRGGKRKRSNFNRVLNRSQYQKLQKILDYKLAVAGLPKPVTVSAAYTSQTCPMCGHQSRENRPKKPDGDGFIMDKFLCQECGYKDDADLNAARVIAMKRAWREGLPQSQRPKLMVNLSEKYQFKTYIKDRAEMRDSGP